MNCCVQARRFRPRNESGRGRAPDSRRRPDFTHAQKIGDISAESSAYRQSSPFNRQFSKLSTLTKTAP